jgi:hypothetical protein
MKKEWIQLLHDSFQRWSNSMDVMTGCACAGPLNASNSFNGTEGDCLAAVPTKSTSPPSLKATAIAAMNEIECSVEWTDLEHLILWHTSPYASTL